MADHSSFYSVRTWLNEALDEENLPPQLAIASSEQRGPGKSFSATDVALEKHFADPEEKLGWMVRYHKMIGVATAQINKVLEVSYPGYWTTTKDLDNTVGEITIHRNIMDEDGEDLGRESHVLGYVLPLNLSDQLKQYSGLFSKIPYTIFDEFMVHSGGSYLPREIEHFRRVLESMNRDSDNAVRPNKVFMLSNSESLTNPYYEAFGLTGRVRGESKRVRGRSWVYEKAVSHAVAEQRINSPLGRLFGITAESYEQGYNDNLTAVAKPKPEWGDGRYEGTITISDRSVGLRYYDKPNLLYVTRRVDKTHPVKLRGSSDDDASLAAVKTHYIGALLRSCWRDGSVRFDTISTKSALSPILN